MISGDACVVGGYWVVVLFLYQMGTRLGRNFFENFMLKQDDLHEFFSHSGI